MITIAFDSKEEDGRIIVRCSDGNMAFDSLVDILDVLLDQRPNVISNWAWNLDLFLAPILKLLGPTLAADLWQNKSCKFAVEDDERKRHSYDIWYSPGKLFKLEGKTPVLKEDDDGIMRSVFPELSIYNLMQYFPEEEMEPRDLVETVAFANIFHRKLATMGLSPRKYTSPIAIFRDIYLTPRTTASGWRTKGGDLPSIEKIPKEAILWASDCTGRLWIEMHQCGKFNHIYDYDLKQAFSRAATTMQDTRECQWVHSKHIPKLAVYGVAKGTIEINPNVSVSPILFAREGEVHKSPTGSWTGFLMLQEIQFIRKWKIGAFVIEDGYWAVPTRIKYPLLHLIDHVNRWRTTEDRFIDLFAKRVANGLVGLFSEEWADTFGPNYNPILAATIQTIVRLRVADLIYRYKVIKDLVHVSVDGFMSTIPLQLTEQDREDWRCTYEGNALVVSSGLVYWGDKKPHGLTLDDLIAMMKANPDSNVYRKTIRRMVTLGEAVEGDIRTLGTMRDYSAAIDLSGEHDRVFPTCPRTGKELLRKKFKSRPFRIIDGEVIQ